MRPRDLVNCKICGLGEIRREITIKLNGEGRNSSDFMCRAAETPKMGAGRKPWKGQREGAGALKSLRAGRSEKVKK